MTYISVYNTDERVYTDERVTGTYFHFSQKIQKSCTCTLKRHTFFILKIKKINLFQFTNFRFYVLRSTTAAYAVCTTYA